VLDAVGAGALPDAAEYGDEGSDTLGNVARAVGGLDLPSMEALGLGNVEALEGCRPQPGAPAVAGRLLSRSKGKDTTTGHWEHMGIVTTQAFPTYPHGFPHDVIDPFMHRTGRGVIGNKPASGRRSSRSSGRRTSARGSGSSTRPPTPSSRSPRTRTRSRSRSFTRRAARRARSSQASTRSGA
jgi:phosphopentomutase